MTEVFVITFVVSTPVVLLLAYVALSSRHVKASRRPFAPVGRDGTVVRGVGRDGFVLICGELWPARTRPLDAGLRAGARVRVVGASGHRLEVEPLD